MRGRGGGDQCPSGRSEAAGQRKETYLQGMRRSKGMSSHRKRRVSLDRRLSLVRKSIHALYLYIH